MMVDSPPKQPRGYLITSAAVLLSPPDPLSTFPFPPTASEVGRYGPPEQDHCFWILVGLASGEPGQEGQSELGWFPCSLEWSLHWLAAWPIC